MDKKIGIFYGSTTGTTAAVAKKIAKALAVPETDVYDVAAVGPTTVGDYDVLLLGSSTWGSGDLQDDWYDFADGLQALDLKGKKIALFGCGDETMTDTFCGAVGDLFHRLVPTRADFIGYFNADGYTFGHTPDELDGNIVGLLIDEVN
ncbi:MAG: flavodoxin domain-containing protein, partial [Paramuribaculum sp.]|nr:flavodoxin domain-containing protein [Paramuribaculum sp.]